uniref:Uncharacterized protein n=1 Tax=Rhizophora mucronata TaxID=61149 RepID=A0A2P2QCW3_RHIMU
MLLHVAANSQWGSFHLFQIH